jgi:selenide,water dikinase
MPEESIRLTQFSKGSGCGCKIAPAILEKLLPKSTSFSYPGLLVGYESNDDAAVYEMENGRCLLSTTDFFTPIVDDPFDFGRIAAANAISDIYAMGGSPVMALAILGWPIEKIPAEIAARVIEGGRSVCAEAGIPLAGGHSIDIPEPVFGLAVSGEIAKKDLKRNNTAREGDVLFLTKPLGSGVLSAALKRGLINEKHKTQLIGQLIKLNSIGKILGSKQYINSITDVTGFGLLGHLLEMMEGSGLSAVIGKENLPKLDGFEEYASQFVYPENTTRNFSAFSGKCSGMENLDFLLCCDPQTNGGLLISADEKYKDDLIYTFNLEKQEFWEIGKVVLKKTLPVEFL